MNTKRKQGSEIPLVEKIVAIIGFVIVTSTLGFMTYEAVAGDHSPPTIRLAVDAITETSQGYRVEIVAINEGGKTASEVQVEGRLPGADAEAAEVTFDFLPPHSERRGGLFFKQKPVKEQISLRATGYREP